MEADCPAADWLQQCRDRVQQHIDAHLAPADVAPERLHDAMRHAALNGGKRFRAGLIYASGLSLGLEPNQLDTAATAVELIHAYSLVHDDLPAMDDDDLRRGQPTLHVAWDEATAILAGDALQALAFEILAFPVTGIRASAQLTVLHEVASAIGSRGMAGGQALDLEAENQSLPLEALERVHRAKTGRLIEASAVLPAQMIAAPSRTIDALRRYAQGLGLAYQVHDDVLDETVDTAILGKHAGADLARGKSTYPARLGIAGSQNWARELAAMAITALDDLQSPVAASPRSAQAIAAQQQLRRLAQWAIERGH
ncbi:MAG: farnesyl diphosphate synthase [Oceanococcaceae bacterium]